MPIPILSKLSELLFPFDVTCSLCRSEMGMGSGSGICQTCEDALPHFGDLASYGNDDCLCAFLYQDDVRRMILGLKYENKRHIARTLGFYLAQCLQANDIYGDALVPVPLHANRLLSRGYNQSELLCRCLGTYLGIPVRTDLLVRYKDTASQTELNAAERRQNVQDAFRSPVKLDGMRVLLVDDVFTTGSTMAACTSALAQAGGVVQAVAAARASSLA